MKSPLQRRALSLTLALILALSLRPTAFAADKAALDRAATGAAAFLLKAVPKPESGSVGGEWAVLGLTRSGCSLPDGYCQAYYAAVAKQVKERKGALHDKKYSEYARVILGLTAAGYDPRDVAGYDLTKPLEDFDKTVWQGLNGPIWALIALDSKNYPNSQREKYIAEILSRQLSDGGWSLSGGVAAAAKNRKADPDLTGMALQALSRYQDKPEVKAATEKALACLSKRQDARGGLASVESVAQTLVALCSLGIPVDDPRFAKKGRTMVDSLLSFAAGDGGFLHTADGSGDSKMSTEQAFYALVAVKRAAEGKNALYDMTDTAKRSVFKPIVTIVPPGGANLR